nr:unnamed protein product [Callosobruchus analis]
MYLTLRLVICAYLPAVFYSTPLNRELLLLMASEEDVEQRDNELEIGYDRSRPNPEELGGYFEGDIILPREMDRNGLTGLQYRWPKGEIPFVITGNYTEKQTQTLKKAMELYHKYTCLTFREKLSNDHDYLAIKSNAAGCWSSIGRQGGTQDLNLAAPDCVVKVGTAIHELMHAAGFVHELTRYDRDKYVEINWDNVREEHKHNFEKQREGEIDEFGVSYDYNSVMHYSKFAFTENINVPSITPKVPSKAKNMGQRLGFSIKDITEVNTMYNCSEKTQVAWDEYNKRKPGVVADEYIFKE